MEFSQDSERKAIAFLVVVAIFAPSILETEILGMGVYVVLDAVFGRNSILGIFWEIDLLWNRALIAEPYDGIYLAFPEFAPVTLLVWGCGFIVPCIVYLVIEERIAYSRGYLILLVLSLVLFFPGITYYSLESYSTYWRAPLPIPELIGMCTMYYYHRQKWYSACLLESPDTAFTSD